MVGLALFLLTPSLRQFIKNVRIMLITQFASEQMLPKPGLHTISVVVLHALDIEKIRAKITLLITCLHKKFGSVFLVINKILRVYASQTTEVNQSFFK